MGVLAETVMSVSGAEVTIGKVIFQLSPMLTLLLLNFSTQGCDAPGSRISYSSPSSLQEEGSLFPLEGQLSIP